MANIELLESLLKKATNEAKQYDRIKNVEDREQAVRIVALLNVYQGFPLEQLTQQEIELAVSTCLRYVKHLDKLVHPDRKPICVLKREYMPAYSKEDDFSIKFD